MKEIIITKAEQNQRLDKFLLKYFNKAPKSFLYKMLRKKRIKRNHSRAEGNEMLQEGDSLQFYLSEETLAEFMQEKTIHCAKRHFAIVYEDNQVLIVSKPAGLLTHPEKSTDTDTLIDQILYYLYQKGEYKIGRESSFTPALCNRLDRNTSGIVLAGKTLLAVQEINDAIANHLIEKYYLTVVVGVVEKPGELRGYLWKDSEKNQSAILSANQQGAKEVLTKYRPLCVGKGYTLLEIQLITGKSHQIRAHFHSIGHSIIGDRKYGKEEVNQLFRQQFALSNQFLHAWKVVWNKKDGNLSYLSKKEIVVPLPKQLEEICKQLFGNKIFYS